MGSSILTPIALFSNLIGMATSFVAMNKQADTAKAQFEEQKKIQMMKELERLKKEREKKDLEMKSKKRLKSVLTAEDAVPSREPQLNPSYGFKGKTLLGE
jgi:hypothetical protein